jgi:hypothetical protein
MKIKIDLHKIYKDVREVDNTFLKIQFEEITGLSNPTVRNWENEAPAIVELIYWNAEMFNHSFAELINKNYNLFPVLKLLKFYQDKTGKPIEKVLIKD